MSDVQARAANALTRGAVKLVVNTPKNAMEACPDPVLQVLLIRELGGLQPGGPPRYKIIMSDGEYWVQGMLSPQCNELHTSGQLKKFSVVRLKGFSASQVKMKRILIVLELEVLDEYWPIDMIGSAQECLPDNPTQNDGPQNTTVVTSNGGGMSGKEFYGTTVKAEPQSSRSLPSRANAPPSSAHSNVSAIESLNPYGHKWAIKARCTHKSDIKTWHNKNGEGKLFSVNLLDESGEIRATGFNDQCDALYDLFQDGGVYYIQSPCKVQLAKKQFSNLANDYELMFERDTVVEKAENQEDVPQVKFNFTTLADLQSVEKDMTVDAIGVLKEVGEVNQIIAKTTSKPYDKRELTLADNSGYTVRLTIWGKTATNFDVSPESVVAFKGLKVSDFGGKSLSLLSSGTLSIDPDIDEAHRLKGWWDAAGRGESFATHQGLGGMGAAGGQNDAVKTIAQVKDEMLGMSEKPDYFVMRATVIFVKQDPVSYPACLSAECNKKVTEEDGGWRCERCQKTHPRPEYRYMIYMNVTDHSGQLALNVFDDAGRIIMGMSADDLQAMGETDPSALSQHFQDANYRTWNFKCRAKMDVYQDQQRVRYNVTAVSPLNYVLEGKKMMEALKLYD